MDTGNRIEGATGCPSWCVPLHHLFHFLCPILFIHRVCKLDQTFLINMRWRSIVILDHKAIKGVLQRRNCVGFVPCITSFAMNMKMLSWISIPHGTWGSANTKLHSKQQLICWPDLALLSLSPFPVRHPGANHGMLPNSTCTRRRWHSNFICYCAK